MIVSLQYANRRLYIEMSMADDVDYEQLATFNTVKWQCATGGG